MKLNFEGRESAIRMLGTTWQEFRNALKDKKFNYKELDKAKKYVFFSTFDDAINYGNNKELLTRTLKEISLNSNLCRATKLGKDDKLNYIHYSRFIPDQLNHPSENRFSPAGIDYLYLGIKFGEFKTTKGRFNTLEETCLKEIRAKSGNDIAFCNFNINLKSYDKKIIDLTITDNKSFEDIQNEFSKWFNSLNLISVHKNASVYLFTLYLKMISEELFKPIETDDKELEYAPFHCLAYYFTSLGFDGILYKSTVYNRGKNLVLFNKYDAKPIGKIKVEKY